MGIMFVTLGVLCLTVIAIVLGMVFGYIKNRNYRKVVNLAIGICAGVLVFCFVLNGIYGNMVDEATALYTDLNIYHELVSETDNEEVRFAHYERVREYNKMYEEIEEIAASKWFGTLVPGDWSENLAPLEFYFHGVYYGED